MVLPLFCFRRIQFGAFGGKGVTEYSFYFCPRFQNDTGSEVWGFCVFYRQVAGIGFLPCCKWRSVSAHRSLTRLIHFFNMCGNFSVYFFTEVSVGYLLYNYLNFFAYDEFKDSEG